MKKIIILLIFVSAFLIITWRISKSRTFQFYDNLISAVETDKKVTAFTFDDGPTDKTGNILKILKSLDVKATFFVTGRELQNNMEYGKEIVSAGHELGNHSFSHKRMVLKLLSFIKKEVNSTDQLIRQAGYNGEIHFRPPFCKKLLFLPYYLNTINKKTITWTLEPETYPDIAVDKDKIVEYINENIKPGSIILLHLMYDSRGESTRALKAIVETLRNKGYSFKTVDQLLTYQNHTSK